MFKGRYIAIILFMLMIQGCKTSQPISSVEPSGFLGDYSKLEPGPPGGPALLYRNPDADFKKYDKFMIDPVKIWYTDDNSLKDVPWEDLHRLALLLQVKIIQALKAEGYTRVQNPGPHVMWVRAALTEAQESNVALDLLTTVVPQARIISGARRLAFGTHSFVGKAGIEGELLDAETRERLGAMVDRRGGGKTLEGSLNSWDDVEQSIEFWADRFGYRICLARGGKYCVPPE
ncbi:MAG: DUF3313 domain-containing protein [Nitrospirota bacterium]|nr:DUF3313 domain-containing protein [Nitrospirota bacterium]